MQEWQKFYASLYVMCAVRFTHSYENIISVENLLEAWKEFRKGKHGKKDVQIFERNLMENIISLNAKLNSGDYKHSKYIMFNVSDPKPRTIHKAVVQDRLLHHALHRILYPFYDKKFIFDSYSCRVSKGTHVAINRFRAFSYKVSKNNTQTAWVLKCDIKKFFASIDHSILSKMLNDSVVDLDLCKILFEVINSFYTKKKGVGIPLGNLTSQLFANIYMDRFDKFIKHTLKVKYYIRYADDFVILSSDKKVLQDYLPKIRDFLWCNLRLELNATKVTIKTLASGVDFLGWINFFDHRVLRSSTKRRILRGMQDENRKPGSLPSYLGLISHGNTKKLRNFI
jgi:retron-type reverse transcriptase